MRSCSQDEWCQICNSLSIFPFPLMIDKACGFWFCPYCSGLLSSQTLIRFSVRPWMCCTTHSAPGESGSMGLSVSLQIHTMCHNLSEWCSHASSNISTIQGLSFSLHCLFHSAASCIYMQVYNHTSTKTYTQYFRNHGRRLVTSWANLWLLYCHTKNENQCPGWENLLLCWTVKWLWWVGCIGSCAKRSS